MYASKVDWDFFNKAIEGLPTREGFKGNCLDKDNVEIPYSCGPHTIRNFREALSIVKPNNILEIGFNLGYSSAMLVLLGENVDSIDISEKWETKYAALYLENNNAGRFNYWNRKDFPEPYGKYDLVFIDGGHFEEDVTNDILLAKKLGTPYLLFDDIYPQYGPGVMPAINKFPELELVKDMNNLRLYKWQH